MHCYKCGEQDPNKLSLKKQQRGIMTFICRACRNRAHAALKARTIRREYINIDIDTWQKEARESRLRIVANHAPNK